MYIRRAQERGMANFGWLQSKHSFSFGSYYDPSHMGVSALRVINDDLVAPAAGFETHGHKDMEIITYVTKGALRHKDSVGNEYVIPAGDVQVMSAGKGIFHSEFNDSAEVPVELLQIWIRPNEKGGKPDYAQAEVKQQGKLTPLVTASGEGDTLPIKQDASISRVVLETHEQLSLSAANRAGYLHLVEGDLVINTGQEELTLKPGDAVAINDNEQLSLTATSAVEALWFDLPKAA